MTTTYDTFAEALQSTEYETPELALENGLSIAGVALSETEFKYFVIPSDTSVDEGHDMAFEIKHGRPIGEYEKWLLSLAKAKVAA